MRISTAQFFDSSAANYQRIYSNVTDSSNEVSSTVKLNTAGDDPIGAARVLQLQQMTGVLNQYNSNIDTVNTNVTQNESVLSSINLAIQRAQDLVIRAGSASFSDKDRQANAAELKEVQSSILGLMNSKDANGSYLFSGSKSTTPPYAINPDGTYSYQGDQTKLNVDVGNGVAMATNTTGWEAFEQAINTTRTATTLTTPATNDGVISMSGGNVASIATYNAKFDSGAPYKINFLSATEYEIRDANDNNVTAESTQGGKFSSDSSAGQTIAFRGVEMTFNINLTEAQRGDPDAATAAVKDHSFKLDVSPSTISTARMPGNTSTAVITGTSITDQDAFNENFPSGGAILKFTSATEFSLYAAPYDAATSKPVSTGTVSNNVATAAGVSFTLNGIPGADDQFTAKSSTQQSQNILNTLSTIITSLNTPVEGDPVALQKLQGSLAAAIGNLTSATEQIGEALADGGARAATATSLKATAQSQIANSNLESNTITAYDPAEAITRLTLQRSMLEASQLVFTQLSSLNLFSKLG